MVHCSAEESVTKTSDAVAKDELMRKTVTLTAITDLITSAETNLQI